MSFHCIHCGRTIAQEALGTRYRNHCPFCLWSVHLDRVPGDRQASCSGAMEPIGLAFKQENGKTGELMVVHRCLDCGAVHKNRLAGDDQADTVLAIFEKSLKEKNILEGIQLLAEADRREIMTQLYGIKTPS